MPLLKYREVPLPSLTRFVATGRRQSLLSPVLHPALAALIPSPNVRDVKANRAVQFRPGDAPFRLLFR